MPRQKSKRREELFNLYARNLQLVKSNPWVAIRIEPDLPDTILCPVCWSLFERRHLGERQALTLDHVPPEGLGGTDAGGVLLCGDCNHRLGTGLDSHLLRTVAAQSFMRGDPGASNDVNVSFDGTAWLPTAMTYGEEGTLQAHFDQSRMNPSAGADLRTHLGSMKDDGAYPVHVRVKGGGTSATYVGLLRIAYLMLFRQFGYGLILSHAYSQLRWQLLKPDEPLYPHTWLMPRDAAQRLPLGVSVVTQPTALRSFIVVFEVGRSARRFKYGALLPLLDAAGVTLYDRLAALNEFPEGTQMHGKQIPPNPDYWTTPEQCMIAYQLSALA